MENQEIKPERTKPLQEISDTELIERMFSVSTYNLTYFLEAKRRGLIDTEVEPYIFGVED